MDQTNKVDLPHGAYTRIARRLRPQVSSEHVRQVALGNRKSPRVERAIENYRRSLRIAETLGLK